MRRFVLLLLVLGAGLMAGGCEEGGTFFSQMAQFVDKEGALADDFEPTVGRYRQSELEKPGALKAQVSDFREKELREREDLSNTWHRYEINEEEKWPSFSVMAQKAEQAPQRKMPTLDDYGRW